eukprot:m.84334 g.84334  ORF g.84334 m.84334 type:complete len:148 (-) comp8341_c0_seq1:508-951(-)
MVMDPPGSEEIRQEIVGHHIELAPSQLGGGTEHQRDSCGCMLALAMHHVLEEFDLLGILALRCAKQGYEVRFELRASMLDAYREYLKESDKFDQIEGTTNKFEAKRPLLSLFSRNPAHLTAAIAVVEGAQQKLSRQLLGALKDHRAS